MILYNDFNWQSRVVNYILFGLSSYFGYLEIDIIKFWGLLYVCHIQIFLLGSVSNINRFYNLQSDFNEFIQCYNCFQSLLKIIFCFWQRGTHIFEGSLTLAMCLEFTPASTWGPYVMLGIKLLSVTFKTNAQPLY